MAAKVAAVGNAENGSFFKMAQPQPRLMPEPETVEERLTKVEASIRLFMQWRAIEFGVWAVLICVMAYLLILRG